MNPAPVQPHPHVCDVHVSQTSIHEASHGIMAIRCGFLHYLHLHPGQDKGGFARCVGRTPLGQLMVHLAGQCGVWQVSPFTRSVPIAVVEGLPVPAAAEIKTGPEIHKETEKALCDRGLPPTNSNDLPHDDDRFSAAIEALAQAGRLKRRPNYLLRWRARIQTRGSRYLIRLECRCAIRALALALEIRRSVSGEEAIAIVAPWLRPWIDDYTSEMTEAQRAEEHPFERAAAPLLPRTTDVLPRVLDTSAPPSPVAEKPSVTVATGDSGGATC